MFEKKEQHYRGSGFVDGGPRTDPELFRPYPDIRYSVKISELPHMLKVRQQPPLTLNPRAVQSAIRKLEALTADASSIDDYEQQLTILMKGYLINAPWFKPGVEIYRARKCSRPVKLSDLSYPPPQSINLLGRANDFNQSMFYGAWSSQVPFFELDVQPGDYVALSKWRTTERVQLNHVGFSSKPKSYENSRRDLDAVYEFVKDTRAVDDLNSLVHDYLAYSFSRPVVSANEYKLTVAISKKMFGNNSLIDGLLYPSIQMNGNADNIVLTPSVVDEKLCFVSVEYIHIKSVCGMNRDINVLDSATDVDTDGNLNWSGRTLHWVSPNDGGYRMVVENGQFVAYDSDGKKVDPT